MSGRARIILVGLAVFYGLVVLRAFQIQVFGIKGIRERGAKQYSARIPLVPKRGVILDRTGSELAVSLSTKSLFVQPAKLKDAGLAAEVLSKRLSLPLPELRKLFESDKSFVWVMRQMPSAGADEAVRAVREAFASRGRGDDDGIGTVEEPKRFYPNRELASSLIGFTNLDSNGIEGVELSLDKYLRGERAFVECERDARGRVITPGNAPNEARSQGHTVALTIDRNIQHTAQSELADSVARHGARGGTAIVMQPATGEILAIATMPAYNPNSPAQAPAEARKNHAITDCFEPGSTFKVFSMASALESGAVKITDRFYCENGSYRYAGRVLHDTHRYGWLTVPEVVKFSSNIGISKITEKMDPGTFYDTIRAFGFGTRTGVELVGEVAGIVPKRQGFSSIRRATVSFGQGISVTPLQLVAGMAAVINGGKVVKPWLVREIRDPEGRVVYRGEPQELRRVISPGTSALVRDMMGKVVQEDGTGTQARIKGFLVGGKTGTAQKVEPGTGRYSSSKRVASFVGFLPLQDPQLLILVVIDEPKGQVYGGVVAAPAFNQIAVKTAYYLGIQPTETAVASAGRPEETPGGRPSVVKVALGRPESAMVMPDLVGLSMGRVLEVMGQYTVKLSLVGSGISVRQAPSPGTLLVPGTECVVTFGAS